MTWTKERRTNFDFMSSADSQTEIKMSERMAQGKQQLKFERNLCIRFRDNCDTEGRWTNFDFMSSADIVKQS